MFFAVRIAISMFNASARAGALNIMLLAGSAGPGSGEAYAAGKDKAHAELEAMIASAVDSTIVPAYQFFADVRAPMLWN